MKSNRTYICCAVVVLFFSMGCQGVQHLLKNGRPEAMWARAKEYYAKEKWSKAATLFEGAAPAYIQTPQEDSIAFMHAYAKFREREYMVVTEELDIFRRRHPRSLFLQEAEELLARSFFNLSPGPQRDQGITTQAIMAINDYMTHYPQSDHIEAMREMNRILMAKLHEKLYLNAYTYYKIGQYRSAIVALKNALKTYPDSEYRERIMYLIVKSSYELASNSVRDKQTGRYLSMLDSYYSFVAEFPESEHLREVERLSEHAKEYLDKNNKKEESI